MKNNTNTLSKIINNLIINKKIKYNTNEYKNNKLFNYNNKWDNTNIISKINNNNLLNTIKNKYIIKKYINYMVNHKLSNLKLNILYKEPIILYKNHKPTDSRIITTGSCHDIYDIILFIYKPLIKINNINEINKINSNDLLITKLINNLINTSNLKNIKINIKPIILTYDYLDSTIYSKLLSKHISKYPKLEPIKNIKFNDKIINKQLINHNNKNKLINNINTFILFNNSSNYIYNNTLIYSNILHQYLIGNIWKYRGKNYNSESNARALKAWNNNKLNVSLSQIWNNNKTNFKLNYYLSSITQSQSNFISKNGKFNIKVTFNHF